MERILADVGISHQQLGACVENAYTVLRERPAPSASSHLLECDSRLRGEGTQSSDRQFGSHSSRADNAATTFDSDVDHIGFGEEEESKSEDALTGHDADQISITPNASKDTLTEATSDLATVLSKSTAAKDSESADELILASETVVRFLQHSIAEAEDRKKRNADKNGWANVILFNNGDLALLSTVNLPRHIVTNVGSTKLLAKFISPFRVLRRLANAYTIELPRKMCTHPTHYVGRHRPYYQYRTSFGEESPCA